VEHYPTGQPDFTGHPHYISLQETP